MNRMIHIVSSALCAAAATAFAGGGWTKPTANPVMGGPRLGTCFDVNVVPWGAANPLVEPAPGAWDSSAVYKPSVFRDEANNRWLLWYNGRRNRREYIGLVEHKGLDLGN